ncbi:MAG TPA: hypothetical protein VKB41_03345 [Steroidobacteraceae bacterium]|nr:hypothetical protein [Steroidobacteraceae bacterium]
MATPAATITPELRSQAWKAILIAGLIAGALDISDAFIVWGLRGVSPVRILQSIASGLLGRPAIDGGAATAALGAFLHFFMTTMMAAFFYFVARRVPLLVKQPIACGIAYGIGLYFFMNFVVLPLSAFPGNAHALDAFPLTNGLLIHCFGVGVPIALVTRRALTPRA